MTPDVKVPLRNLAGEFGVSLHGLDDDQLHHVAIRFLLADDLRAEALQAIVDDVRRVGVSEADGLSQSKVSASKDSGVTPPSAPRSRPGFRFNSTEADRKQRQKLADQHAAESRRTGLYLVPRRPEVLPAGKPHPACLAAARDGGTPCSRCSWLLEGDPYAEAWLDRDD